VNAPLPQASQIVHEMALQVAALRLPLADRNGIMVELHRLNYRPADIVRHIDVAIEKARDLRAKNGWRQLGDLTSGIIRRLGEK